MKCLVINLDRSRDRLAHVTAEFARICVAFERVAAVDARDRPNLAALPQGKKHLRMADGEIACLLSHKQCWSIIAAGEDAYGAIFEDDIVFADKAGPLLAGADWIPADADIVKLETFFNRTVISRKQVACGHGFSASRLHAVHIGTAGYILSRQAARDLIEATNEIAIPVDHLVFNPRFATSSRHVIYQLVPALCLQAQFLGGGPVQLPSLLKQERTEEWVASGRGKKRDKPIAAKVGIETRRLARQIADLFRLRREKIIPFEYRGRRIRRPHTQRRENAL
ncbi:glycosyltransferase family 25 protein [Mesorhizobium neociceri]|uniref:Glycosyltransferase family 25 protein n=1 Tax=Mesorhizobium neociceri TaxID=1307853 RepID=A0A838B1Q7_9HYPH|nr:glycosyltransferase family 25 protein [Mesorhizobium neociceri]MBA1139764.1 glycosyltransferase family 25 protein [Mesorhizobium neociceri]